MWAVSKPARPRASIPSPLKAVELAVIPHTQPEASCLMTAYTTHTTQNNGVGTYTQGHSTSHRSPGAQVLVLYAESLTGNKE